MLTKLRQLDADGCNVVRFHEHFVEDDHPCLVFEMLDVSLHDFIYERRGIGLPLADIRAIMQQVCTDDVWFALLYYNVENKYTTIIEETPMKRESPCRASKIPNMFSVFLIFHLQLATAFQALKGIGLIHADLKPDNIMIVDPEQQPLRVKLIDFGLAKLTKPCKPKRGMSVQHVWFR